MTSHRTVLAHRRPVVVSKGGDVVPVVVKGDVVGSVEALESVLSLRQPSQIGVSVVHSGVGPVSESDVDMASSANGRTVVSESDVASSANGRTVVSESDVASSANGRMLLPSSLCRCNPCLQCFL